MRSANINNGVCFCGCILRTVDSILHQYRTNRRQAAVSASGDRLIRSVSSAVKVRIAEHMLMTMCIRIAYNTTHLAVLRKSVVILYTDAVLFIHKQRSFIPCTKNHFLSISENFRESAVHRKGQTLFFGFLQIGEVDLCMKYLFDKPAKGSLRCCCDCSATIYLILVTTILCSQQHAIAFCFQCHLLSVP